MSDRLKSDVASGPAGRSPGSGGLDRKPYTPAPRAAGMSALANFLRKVDPGGSVPHGSGVLSPPEAEEADTPAASTQPGPATPATPDQVRDQPVARWHNAPNRTQGVARSGDWGHPSVEVDHTRLPLTGRLRNLTARSPRQRPSQPPSTRLAPAPVQDASVAAPMREATSSIDKSPAPLAETNGYDSEMVRSATPESDKASWLPSQGSAADRDLWSGEQESRDSNTPTSLRDEYPPTDTPDAGTMPAIIPFPISVEKTDTLAREIEIFGETEVQEPAAPTPFKSYRRLYDADLDEDDGPLDGVLPATPFDAGLEMLPSDDDTLPAAPNLPKLDPTPLANEPEAAQPALKLTAIDQASEPLMAYQPPEPVRGSAEAHAASGLEEIDAIPEQANPWPAMGQVEMARAPEQAPAPAPAQPLSPMALELLDIFMEEATGMLDGLHAALEILERSPSAEALIEARRTVHTVKGGARICGLPALTDLAHTCEDAIGQFVAGQDALPPAMITVLFLAEREMRAALLRPNIGPGSDESLIALTRQVREARQHAAVAPISAPKSDPADFPSQIVETERPGGKAQAPATAEPEKPHEPVPMRLGEHSPLLRRPTITSVAPNTNRLAVDLTKVEEMVAKVTEIVANRAASHSMAETMSGTVSEMMRTVQRLQSIMIGLQYQISAQGLDVTAEQDPEGLALETYGPLKQLMLQLQEAVADQQALVQSSLDIATNRRSLAQIEARLDTDLQAALLNMRLLPLSGLRVRLDQVVRSAAATAEREVQWTMEGQEVALDKHVCDRIFEPLMHLLRNAIDHGIEPPDEREAAGKPRTGQIAVRAVVEGSQVMIAVIDDGRGMDPDRLAAVAVQRKVISTAEAARLTPREKLDLVFRPGFSTASRVTELSGRGMGMEIVREACTRIGGTVAITPNPQGGTIITLHVPLSMSVIHILVVRVGASLLGIPASQVTSVHLVHEGALIYEDDRQMVRIGHAQLPIYALPSTRVHAGQWKDREERSVLLVPHHSDQVAVLVDEVVSEDDQIVKPLPLLLQGVDRLLGAIILADGSPAPVLNLPPLLDQIATLGGQQIEPAPDPSGEQTVLVIDDSLTMRFALSQSLQHAGYTVLTARDGQEALELIRAGSLPSLVTLDIEMPKMDGLETLYAIRHLPGGATLPVFILTSRTGEKHRRTAMQMGATRYFTKPYRDSEFLGAVQDAISGSLVPIG